APIVTVLPVTARLNCRFSSTAPPEPSARLEGPKRTAALPGWPGESRRCIRLESLSYKISAEEGAGPTAAGGTDCVPPALSASNRMQKQKQKRKESHER